MTVPWATRASTSATPTSTRMRPSGNCSAHSIWSRSFDVSLSIEDHSRLRRSCAPGTAGSSGCASIAASCWSVPWREIGLKAVFEHDGVGCRDQIEMRWMDRSTS